MKRTVRIKKSRLLLVILIVLVASLSLLTIKLTYKDSHQVFDPAKEINQIRAKRTDVFSYL